MPTATLTATQLDLDAAGLLLVAEVEAYLRTVGHPLTPAAPVRTLTALINAIRTSPVVPLSNRYGSTVQPWHAAITLPEPTALDRIRRRRPGAQVTARQHLDLLSRYIHQHGWLQGALWDDSGRVCVLGAQLRIVQAGYSTPAVVNQARLLIGNQLGYIGQGMPIDTWNESPAAAQSTSTRYPSGQLPARSTAGPHTTAEETAVYQPINGDRILMTRVHADGRTTRVVGIISELREGGFRLTGHDCGGRTVDGYYATNAVWPRSGVASQTITPAP